MRTLAERVATHPAGGSHRVGESGKQLVEDLPATRMQAMHLPAVRHSLPVLADAGKDVAFDQGDTLIVVGEHACASTLE
jgi:hypothetical protein